MPDERASALRRQRAEVVYPTSAACTRHLTGRVRRGSALTVAPIQAMIKGFRLPDHVPLLRLGQGIIIVILAFFLLAPKPDKFRRRFRMPTSMQTRRNYQPTQVMRHPIFWLMYFMFVIVGAGGLMVTARPEADRGDWKVDTSRSR